MKKKIIPDLIILAVFALAAVIYCYPALEGKVIFAGDNINGTSAIQEGLHYRQETGNQTWWTGSMFSGMPNYQIGGGASYAADRVLNPFIRFFRWGTRNCLFIVLFYLVAFYLLLRTFKIDKWISMAGAFATAFSSYFFIIIAASHHGKTVAITWMTLVLIGFLLIYRKQYGWGALLTMFFIPMGFFLHPQMSYYMCMLIGVLFLAEVWICGKQREWRHLGVATCVFALSFGIGIGIGSANLFSNQEYAEQTMRGGHSDLEKANDATNKTAGLDLDYATAWSEGIGESMTFLVPNLMGGASGYNLGSDSRLYRELTAKGVQPGQARQFCSQAPTYWGDKAFTSGPVYMGAVVCLLFVFGLLVVGGPWKWALLVATLLSVMLSWGRHFMPLTELFFNYFPMYNKFRAVESILIVAEITVPLLGFLALKEITDGRQSKETLLRKLYWATGITGGLCLLIALFGGMMFDFTSTYDSSFASQLPDWAYAAIVDQREAMMRSDAWRSLLFVLLGAGLVWFYVNDKLKTQWFGLTLTALVVADMWPVDKRFFNSDNFVSPKQREAAFRMEDYERQLLQDPAHFRVLNLSTNTFNEARTSYYLKSIGGYSAAKLRRYQDLIDRHIAPEMNPLMQSIMQTNGQLAQQRGDSIYPVLNMLNMKYAIVGLQGGQKVAVENPHALGNAWVVDSLVVVDNANAEIDALSTLDLRHAAVVDRSQLPASSNRTNGGGGTVELSKYTPEYIEYDAQLTAPGTVVFSEIYYPYGWKALVDGQPADHYRVDYMLRALDLEAGTHHIRFEFRPESVSRGNRISMVCLCLMLLTLIGVMVYEGRKFRLKHD